MTTAEVDVARRFAAAFTARDIEGVLDCFTPDARYVDLFYGTFHGRAGLRRLLDRMYSEGDGHEWVMTRVATSATCVIGEWRFTFTVSAAVPQSSGLTLRFGGASVFETRGGLCHAYREYFDRGAALLALGIAPAVVAQIAAGRPTIEITGAELAQSP